MAPIINEQYMNKIISVNSYPDRITAEIAKGLLESNGITCFIKADDAGGIAPYRFTGAELMIREEDFSKVKELLDTSPK